jgi:hypothetical protein
MTEEIKTLEIPAAPEPPNEAQLAGQYFNQCLEQIKKLYPNVNMVTRMSIEFMMKDQEGPEEPTEG